MCINLGPALQGGGWAGRGGGLGGRRKTPQVKTRGHQLPSDGSDHSTRPKGHHSGRGWNYSAKVSVKVLQGCKSTPQKSRPIESGHERHAVQVANVCSYKLG